MPGAHWGLAPFYAPGVFSLGLIFSGLSVAVLSFLGFDAISTLAEEARGGARVVGQATLITLCLAAALFSFLLLHVSVVAYFFVKQRTGTIALHLTSPIIAFVVIAFVLAHADVHAKVGGGVWLVIGRCDSDWVAARRSVAGAQAGSTVRLKPDTTYNENPGTRSARRHSDP